MQFTNTKNNSTYTYNFTHTKEQCTFLVVTQMDDFYRYCLVTGSNHH